MHTLILGGGIIGLSSAYYALQKGLQVTLVTREAADGDNCSIGNAGMIVPSHFTPLAAPGVVAQGLRWMFHPKSPFFIRPRPSLALARWCWLFLRHANARHVAASRRLLLALNLASRQLHIELAAHQNPPNLVQRGLLMLCKTSAALEEEAEIAQHARQLGLPAELLDPAATAALDPTVTMDIRGAVYFPQDCHLNPAQLVAALRHRIVEMGATIVPDTDISGFQVDRGTVTAALAADGRSFAADAFVIAAGSWSAQLAARLGCRLPLQPGKGYSLTLPEPPQLPQLCSILTEAKVAVTPMGPSLRIAGTMEVGNFNLAINPTRLRGIIESVPRYFPAFPPTLFTGLPAWSGLRPTPPDGLPYLGPLPRHRNVLVATGHGMMGLSLGPITGQLVAALLTDSQPPIPLAQLAPDRFS